MTNVILIDEFNFFGGAALEILEQGFCLNSGAPRTNLRGATTVRAKSKLTDSVGSSGLAWSMAAASQFMLL